jgi:hypothetical protein
VRSCAGAATHVDRVRDGGFVKIESVVRETAVVPSGTLRGRQRVDSYEGNGCTRMLSSAAVIVCQLTDTTSVVGVDFSTAEYDIAVLCARIEQIVSAYDFARDVTES